jgi:hypothetical protein
MNCWHLAAVIAILFPSPVFGQAPIIAASSTPTPATLADDSPYQGVAPFSLPPRYALVIGIGTVQPGNGVSGLPNPINDANKVSDALKRAGFLVTNLTDDYSPQQMTRQNIKRAVNEQSMTLRSSSKHPAPQA